METERLVKHSGIFSAINRGSNVRALYSKSKPTSKIVDAYFETMGSEYVDEKNAWQQIKLKAQNEPSSWERLTIEGELINSMLQNENEFRHAQRVISGEEKRDLERILGTGAVANKEDDDGILIDVEVLVEAANKVEQETIEAVKVDQVEATDVVEQKEQVAKTDEAAEADKLYEERIFDRKLDIPTFEQISAGWCKEECDKEAENENETLEERLRALKRYL